MVYNLGLLWRRKALEVVHLRAAGFIDHTEEVGRRREGKVSDTHLAHLQLQEERVDEAEFALSALVQHDTSVQSLAATR